MELKIMKYNGKNFGRLSKPLVKKGLDWSEFSIDLEDDNKIKIPTSQIITNFLLKLLWIFADDVTNSFSYLGEVYDNVPDHLKYVTIDEIYIYNYPKEHRKEILEWLNEKE